MIVSCWVWLQVFIFYTLYQLLTETDFHFSFSNLKLCSSFVTTVLQHSLFLQSSENVSREAQSSDSTCYVSSQSVLERLFRHARVAKSCEVFCSSGHNVISIDPSWFSQLFYVSGKCFCFFFVFTSISVENYLTLWTYRAFSCVYEYWWKFYIGKFGSIFCNLVNQFV